MRIKYLIKEFKDAFKRIKRYGLINKEFNEALKRYEQITESAKNLRKS